MIIKNYKGTTLVNQSGLGYEALESCVYSGYLCFGAIVMITRIRILKYRYSILQRQLAFITELEQSSTSIWASLFQQVETLTHELENQ